ncbi:hypothetical protein AO263_32550 [Pseudomonas sp. NZIPFR-PS5]|nr:hypothetical protein AO263_32550 [Pseudomonas sp. NZIPFR-PS5]
MEMPNWSSIRRRLETSFTISCSPGLDFFYYSFRRIISTGFGVVNQIGAIRVFAEALKSHYRLGVLILGFVVHNTRNSASVKS